MYTVDDGKLKDVFRRGTIPAEIASIHFSPDSKYIGISSSSGTGHIFKIEDENTSDGSRFNIIHGGNRDFARFYAKGKSKILAVVPKPY